MTPRSSLQSLHLLHGSLGLLLLVEQYLVVAYFLLRVLVQFNLQFRVQSRKTVVTLGRLTRVLRVLKLRLRLRLHLLLQLRYTRLVLLNGQVVLPVPLIEFIVFRLELLHLRRLTRQRGTAVTRTRAANTINRVLHRLGSRNDCLHVPLVSLTQLPQLGNEFLYRPVIYDEVTVPDALHITFSLSVSLISSSPFPFYPAARKPNNTHSPSSVSRPRAALPICTGTYPHTACRTSPQTHRSNRT